MSYVTDYLDLMQHVLSHLRQHRGEVLRISSHLTRVANQYIETDCATVQFEFVYDIAELDATGNKLMVMGHKELFEVFCDRICHLELKDGDIHINEELGGVFRQNVLRVYPRSAA